MSKAPERIDELEAKLKEASLQSISDLGQAQQAYQAQLLAEAKLARAVEFTKGVIRHAGNSGDDYLAEQARTTLAELKGQDDE